MLRQTIEKEENMAECEDYADVRFTSHFVHVDVTTNAQIELEWISKTECFVHSEGSPSSNRQIENIVKIQLTNGQKAQSWWYITCLSQVLH